MVGGGDFVPYQLVSACSVVCSTSIECFRALALANKKNRKKAVFSPPLQKKGECQSGYFFLNTCIYISKTTAMLIVGIASCIAATCTCMSKDYCCHRTASENGRGDKS